MFFVFFVIAMTLSIEDGAMIFNSYHWSILISDDILDSLQTDLGISSVREFVSLLQDDSTHLKDIGRLFSERAITKLKAVINIWNTVAACDENGLTEDDRRRRGSGSNFSDGNRLYFSPSRRDDHSHSERMFSRKRLDSDDATDVDSCQGGESIDLASSLFQDDSDGTALDISDADADNVSSYQNDSHKNRDIESNVRLHIERTLTITDVKLDELIQNDDSSKDVDVEGTKVESTIVSECDSSLDTDSKISSHVVPDHDFSDSTPLVVSDSVSSVQSDQVSDNDERTSLIDSV